MKTKRILSSLALLILPACISCKGTSSCVISYTADGKEITTEIKASTSEEDVQAAIAAIKLANTENRELSSVSFTTSLTCNFYSETDTINGYFNVAGVIRSAYQTGENAKAYREYNLKMGSHLLYTAPEENEDAPDYVNTLLNTIHTYPSYFKSTEADILMESYLEEDAIYSVISDSTFLSFNDEYENRFTEAIYGTTKKEEISSVYQPLFSADSFAGVSDQESLIDLLCKSSENDKALEISSADENGFVISTDKEIAKTGETLVYLTVSVRYDKATLMPSEITYDVAEAIKDYVTAFNVNTFLKTNSWKITTSISYNGEVPVLTDKTDYSGNFKENVLKRLESYEL